jgi:hypothetical protein
MILLKSFTKAFNIFDFFIDLCELKKKTNTPNFYLNFFFYFPKLFWVVLTWGSFQPFQKRKRRRKQNKTLFCIIHSELILTSRKKLVELSSSPTR